MVFLVNLLIRLSKLSLSFFLTSNTFCSPSFLIKIFKVYPKPDFLDLGQKKLLQYSIVITQFKYKVKLKIIEN